MDSRSELEKASLQVNRIALYSSHEEDRLRPRLTNNDRKRGGGGVDREKLAFAQEAVVPGVVQALPFQLPDGG